MMLTIEQLVIMNAMADDEELFEQIVRDVNCKPLEFIKSPLPENVVKQVLLGFIESLDVYVLKDDGRHLVAMSDNEEITFESLSNPSYWYGMTAQGRSKWEPWASA